MVVKGVCSLEPFEIRPTKTLAASLYISLNVTVLY